MAKVKRLHPEFDSVAECQPGTTMETHWFQAGELVTRSYEPLDELVTQDEMKQLWVELEVSPVFVLGHLFDCKPIPDEIRIRDAIKYWTAMPQNIWRTADTPNTTYPIKNKKALTALMNAIYKKRAIRSSKLFKKKQEFAALGIGLTRRHLSNAGWL